MGDWGHLRAAEQSLCVLSGDGATTDDTQLSLSGVNTGFQPHLGTLGGSVQLSRGGLPRMKVLGHPLEAHVSLEGPGPGSPLVTPG